ncbi:MAG: addiction module protein [Planctomycetaceae bacterium]|nr:addiction module protein [Planctomycetaceae bacterium]
MSTYADVLRVVLSLSPEQRRELASAIDASLEAVDATAEGTANLSPAWRAEIARRSAEIEAGTAKFFTWEETQQRARERAARDE